MKVICGFILQRENEFFLEIKTVWQRKRQHHSNSFSDTYLKGTVVNRIFRSLIGGSTETLRLQSL